MYSGLRVVVSVFPQVVVVAVLLDIIHAEPVMAHVTAVKIAVAPLVINVVRVAHVTVDVIASQATHSTHAAVHGVVVTVAVLLDIKECTVVVVVVVTV